MSSGFVSAGVVDPDKQDAWAAVKQQLESERKSKAEQGQQEGGKSLYEVLQQNKEAKREAFEESIRLKNQFRSLDEDEVEFLDSLLESTRAKEDALHKETTEKLEFFHQQREEMEKARVDAGGGQEIQPGALGEEEKWTISGRKRRRTKEKEGLLGGLKYRKTSSSTPTDIITIVQPGSENGNGLAVSNPSSKAPVSSAEASMGLLPSPPTAANEAIVAGKLGLGAYSSDEDEDAD
ncbi:hypothetical protein FQN57_005182 [Myotisia sp. PD_48]|nr:hypothetical protein FQN57_005182 [Myotisia sp. PD_48]